ncbi:hypothetical protein SLS62_000676 [Diatrype stigma]|uniref:Major facilitator superfamily (MFS) profile domain-containing protein n=1 Tax=Diatrype stigma TaxID=117547 RepID=A0AAN9YWM5_9PEZI
MAPSQQRIISYRVGTTDEIQTIAHDLSATTLEAFWASIAFMLAVVIVQPVYTSISNVFGRLAPLYVAFCFFMIGSIVFAISIDMGVLITGRVLQGIGAGGLDVLNEIILADITTLKERPMYLGMMAIPVAGGTILGPIIGGLLSQYATWRWVGWINLPVSAVGLVLVIFFLKLQALKASVRQKLRRLDWTGLIFFTGGCTLVALPVAWAGALFPWSSWKTILPLCLGVLLLVGFSWYETKPEEPVFPYRIFKHRTAAVSLFGALLHGLVAYSIVFYAPLFFQAVFLDDPLQSAVSTLPLACCSVAFGVIGAVAVEVIRKYRLIILASWVFAAVGMGLLTLWDRDASRAAKASFQIILGIGTGNLFSVLNLPMQASVPHVDDMGLAAGTLISFRLFGALIGLSMCSTVFTSVFSMEIGSLGPLPDSIAVLYDAQHALESIPLLRQSEISSEALDVIIKAYMSSMYAVFWMLAGVSLVGFLSSFLIKEISLEKEELGRQQFDVGQ